VVLIACERRGGDEIPDFFSRLEQWFEVTTEWTNYEDEELDVLLASSHVADERKPLRIHRAIRRKGP